MTSHGIMSFFDIAYFVEYLPIYIEIAYFVEYLPIFAMKSRKHWRKFSAIGTVSSIVEAFSDESFCVTLYVYFSKKNAKHGNSCVKQIGVFCCSIPTQRKSSWVGKHVNFAMYGYHMMVTQECSCSFREKSNYTA